MRVNLLSYDINIFLEGNFQLEDGVEADQCCAPLPLRVWDLSDDRR